MIMQYWSRLDKTIRIKMGKLVFCIIKTPPTNSDAITIKTRRKPTMIVPSQKPDNTGRSKRWLEYRYINQNLGWFLLLSYLFLFPCPMCVPFATWSISSTPLTWKKTTCELQRSDVFNILARDLDIFPLSTFFHGCRYTGQRRQFQLYMKTVQPIVSMTFSLQRGR